MRMGGDCSNSLHQLPPLWVITCWWWLVIHSCRKKNWVHAVWLQCCTDCASLKGCCAGDITLFSPSSVNMFCPLPGPGLAPLLLPGLGLIQTLICDGHDPLEDCTNILLLVDQVRVFPYVVGINMSLHHALLVLHTSSVAGVAAWRDGRRWRTKRAPSATFRLLGPWKVCK